MIIPSRSIQCGAVIVWCLCVITCHTATAQDTPIAVYFSPGDECGRVLLETIDRARNTIEVAVYLITSRSLANALINAHNRGVTVRVYVDGENATESYSKAGYLKRAGIDVRRETGEGLMHNKFCIVDDETVATGSYNWTTSADLVNDENIVVIRSGAIARQFRKAFERYWEGTFTDVTYYRDKERLLKVPAR